MTKRVQAAVALMGTAAATLGWAAAAAAAPVENGKIAYTRDCGIYTVNPDGSGQVLLATEGNHPAWSPDGRKLAFSREYCGIPASGIYVVNADGSGETKLSDGGERPAWSPDGTKLAFNTYDDVWVMNADGSGTRNLTNFEGYRTLAQWPTWSPEGDRIAYVKRIWLLDGAGDGDHYSDGIHVMNSDGSGQRALTSGEHEEPAWSPDGTKIAFWALRSPYVGIHAVNVDGSGQTQLVADTYSGGTSRIQWSPDGTKIVYSGAGALKVMNADGSGLTRLGIGGADPAWQPKPCTIVGTNGSDVLTGTSNNDVICGMGGNDNMRGGGGNDLLRGGLGNDTLLGDGGSDRVNGGFGDDVLDGGTGPDVFSGGPGVDRVAYWSFSTAVTVTIDDGPNDGKAGEGDDVPADIENLSGGKGNDTLIGNEADNEIGGGPGNDRLVGGAGRDKLLGGDGDDVHDADDGVRDSVTCGNGLDSVLRDPFDAVWASCE